MHRDSSLGISIAGRLHLHSCKNFKYFENFFSSILLYNNDLKRKRSFANSNIIYTRTLTATRNTTHPGPERAFCGWAGSRR